MISLEQLHEYAVPATIAHQQLEIETTKMTSFLETNTSLTFHFVKQSWTLVDDFNSKRRIFAEKLQHADQQENAYLFHRHQVAAAGFAVALIMLYFC